MKKTDFEKIENVIGYHFKNKNLLEQAFIRSSYANEHDIESNEVLEFVGDKVLDLAVVRIMLEKFSVTGDTLISSKDEGDLTDIKESLVNSHYLAYTFDSLSLSDFIALGKVDLNNDVKEKTSIKEDTFEAIIGAIAIDSNWDMEVIIEIVRKLLNTDAFFERPEMDSNYFETLEHIVCDLNKSSFNCKIGRVEGSGKPKWRAVIKVADLKHKAYGYSISEMGAKEDAAANMLRYLRLHSESLMNSTREKRQQDIFERVNYFVQRKLIPQPTYSFNESFDEDGNPIWECRAQIGDQMGACHASASSKKEAQKIALERAFTYFVDNCDLGNLLDR